MKRILFLMAPVAVALLVGCWVGADDRPSGGTKPGPTTAPTTPTKQALLVTVDTDKVMNATGGDGVGVFVEYKTGGTWHVWWTCDTNKSSLPCDFDIKATVASGAIKNLQSDHLLATDQAKQNADGSVQVIARANANVAGVFFETDPGARVTIDANIRDVPKAGDYLFFVQDGKVNGGYAGVLTNPLMLEPSTP